MLFKLAWRNIWRNKRRSLLVLGSVVIGLIAILLSDGLSNGMLQQMLSNQISSSVSHIQIHEKGFNDNKIIKNYIHDYHKVENIIRANPQIEAYSKRVITFGLLSSASNSSGVYIYGINPTEEAKVSKIKSEITQGKYLSDKKGEIIIGKKLADRLDVELGDKVVAMANSLDGKIGSDLFRVAGIFETVSSEFDKSTIYISAKSAQEMLVLGDKYYEFALITKNYKETESIKKNLLNKIDGRYEVLSYEDLLPFLIMQLDLYQESMIFLTLIIGLALIFGIINTMLMSVFERIQEFGVLMAIGMKNSRLFGMIVLEAFILGALGTMLGLIFGIVIHIPLAHAGIDFSVFAESLESLGVGAVIYPVLSIENTINMVIIIPLIAVIGALYPAYKAVRLQPIYAIRHV